MKLPNSLIAIVFQVLSVAVIIRSQKTNYDKIVEAFPDLSLKRNQATASIISLQNDDSGWVDTVEVVTTLQLSNEKDWNIPNDKKKLSIKQMTLEIISGMGSKDPEKPLTTGAVTKYANAIMSTCKDPKNYYGYDVISKLSEMEANYSFLKSYRALTLCNSGVQIPNSLTEILLDIIQNNTIPLFPQDTSAITLMALTCIHKQNGLSEEVLNQNAKLVSKFQDPDGSFGNIYSTGIVVEALLPFLDTDFSWNVVSAVQFILNQQKTDGSFGNLGATLSVLPILSGRNLLSLPDLQCENTEETIIAEEETAITEVPSTDANTDTKSLQYSIWIGDDVTEEHTIELTVPEKSSVYEMMQIAESDLKTFRFTAEDTVYGHFVTSINGIKNDDATSMYWMYGLLINEETREVKMADKGVDDFIPVNSDHIIFWYKKYSS